MSKLVLTKQNVQIVLETFDNKVTIHYEFINDADTSKDSLEDYIYLLDKIQTYMKSGEYEVKKETA
jgi:hypothetical protein